MLPPRLKSAARAPALIALALATTAIAAIALPAPAHTASSGNTAVGASILATTSIDTTACPHANLGNLLAGAVVMSNPCTVTFGSSNDTARLRVHQRDRYDRAMTRARSTWNILSTTGRFRSIHQPSDDRIWAVGQAAIGGGPALIATSTDQGSTWTYQTPCTSATNILDVHAFSDTVAVTGGAHPCRTVNGGGTWTSVADLAGFTWRSIDGLDDGSSSFAWAVSSSDSAARVRRTTDSGATWQNRDIPGTSQARGVLAISANEAMVVASPTIAGEQHARLWYTIDGGLSWDFKPIATLPLAEHLSYIDRSPTGTIVVSGARTYRSDDDGDTWTETSTMPRQGLRHVSGTTWVGTFSTSNTRRSVNDGASWVHTPITDVGDYALHEPSNLVDGKFFVPGLGETILVSDDLGATYTEVSPYQPRFNDAAAFDDRAFVAVGDDGIVRWSDDATTLHDGVSGVTNTLHSVRQTAPDTAIAVGGGGTMLRTTDAGATWSPVAHPATGTLLRQIVEAPGTGILYVVGNAGTILRSVDRGDTWTTIPSGTGTNLSSIATSTNGQKLWVGTTNNGEVRYSDDGGQTWVVRSTGHPRHVKALAALADEAVLAVHGNHDPGSGTMSSVMRSSNAGETWTTVLETTVFGKMEALDDRHVVLYRNNGIVRSFDGGWTFPMFATSSASTPGGVAIDIHTIVGVGAGNSIAVLPSGTSIPDVGESGATFASATGAFGACLQGATSTIATHWSPAGTCDLDTAGHWHGIPASAGDASASVATSISTTDATATFRFGLRPGDATPSGDYLAHVAFEVTAPAL